MSVPPVNRIDVVDEDAYLVTFADGLAVRFEVAEEHGVRGANPEPDPFMRGRYGDPRPVVAAVLAVHDARAALRGAAHGTDPVGQGPARDLIGRAVHLARAGELDALGALINWPLSGAARVFVGLTELPERNRGWVVDSGLSELDAAHDDPAVAGEILSALAAQLAAVREVVPVPADRRVQALAGWLLPVAPAGLTDAQRDRLDRLRHEVADLTGLFELRGSPAGLVVAVTADGGSLVVPIPG
ncbi:MAG: hypothetical protein WCA46_00995 [Actinocatenispora sp.]